MLNPQQLLKIARNARGQMNLAKKVMSGTSIRVRAEMAEHGRAVCERIRSIVQRKNFPALLPTVQISVNSQR
ncbi:MAG: hypothetical protein JSU82_02455 [Rhodospirillales bacterium]|nr:MAG: hypothetical protein JSU82_02455 [Rhodospirillales bacterium]